MTNYDKIRKMSMEDFYKEYVSPYGSFTNWLCGSIHCSKCPALKYCDSGRLDGLDNWFPQPEIDISHEAKKLDYSVVLSSFYFCRYECECDLCPLNELEDTCCDDIFDYHFSQPDCPFDPREFKKK